MEKLEQMRVAASKGVSTEASDGRITLQKKKTSSSEGDTLQGNRDD